MDQIGQTRQTRQMDQIGQTRQTRQMRHISIQVQNTTAIFLPPQS